MAGSWVCWAVPPLLSPLPPPVLCCSSLHSLPPTSRHKGGDLLRPPYSCSACDSAPESPLPLLSPCRQCCALGRGRLQWGREERRRQSRPSQSGPAPTQRTQRDYTTTTTHTTIHKQTTRMSLHSHASHSDWLCGYGTIRYATPTCTETQNDFYLLQSLSDSLQTRRADTSHLFLHIPHTFSFLRHHYDELFKKETNKSDVHEYPFPPSLNLLFHLLPSFQTLRMGSPLRSLSP